MLQEFVDGGRLVDVAILVTLLEGLALVAYRRLTGRGPAPADVAAMLGAGLCLMLALRAALTGAAGGTIAVFLGAALVAHLVDLRRRWPRGVPR
jgi:hypothetical protein